LNGVVIHASDHDAAPKLMNRAYGHALEIKESTSDGFFDFLKTA
jgi:hypothetical protein